MPEPSKKFSSYKGTLAAKTTAEITDANTTHTPCKGIYVGVDGNYDFRIDGVWEPHLGAKAGSIIPVEATGARLNPSSDAPTASSIVFYY